MAGKVRIEADGVAVECLPQAGFTITAITDMVSGANALWTRGGFSPAAPGYVLGPSGEASIESFSDLFVGGWFEMFPTAGYPGTLQGSVGPARSLLHGEVMRLPWDLIEQSTTAVEATVATIRTPFRLTRRLAIESAQLVIRETIENVGRVPVPYVWGHHPCFSRQTFAGGRLELDAASSLVPGPVFDEANNTLVAGAAFEFPQAPTNTGAMRDVAHIPVAADGRHEQSSVVLRSGGLRITAPSLGRAFSLRWDVGDFPFALIWQDYQARDAAFWGTCDTFAVEPSSAPGRSLDDAVAAAAIRHLEPGTARSLELRAMWRPLDRDAPA